MFAEAYAKQVSGFGETLGWRRSLNLVWKDRPPSLNMALCRALTHLVADNPRARAFLKPID